MKSIICDAMETVLKHCYNTYCNDCIFDKFCNESRYDYKIREFVKSMKDYVNNTEGVK